MLWRLVTKVAREPEVGQWSPDGQLTLELRPRAPLQHAELALYKGGYEHAERRLVEQLVEPGSLCVDVGASFGIYTLLLATLVGPTGRVIAYEPSPLARTRLHDAVASIPWVEVYPFAVGGESNEDTLVVAPGDSMHSSLRKQRRPPGEHLVVQVRPLVDLVEENTEIGFVKVDVEGGEAGVVEGMSSLLAQGRIASAMFEVEPRYGNVDWLDDLADKDGYIAYRLELASHAFRWRSRLTPLFPGERFSGSLFLIRADRDRSTRMA